MHVSSIRGQRFLDRGSGRAAMCQGMQRFAACERSVLTGELSHRGGAGGRRHCCCSQHQVKHFYSMRVADSDLRMCRRAAPYKDHRG